MSKTERGLPKSFDIRVPAGAVSLGDYLDEAPPVARPAPPAPQPVTRAAEAPAFAAPLVAPQVLPKPLVQAPPQPPPQTSPSASIRGASPPRKQFNMSPATLNMLDELLTHVRAYSAERDVRASEVVHALVLAVHEVRPYLDLTRVPPRGKWGSPAAAALPVALKEAFQTAIARAAAAAAGRR